MCTHRKRYGRDREIAYNRYLIFDDKNHLIWVFWHEGVKNVEKK
jgi:flavorubredoxin